MSKWLDYARWNKRNERMSKLWILGVSTWIKSNIENKQTKKILDYGCSYFCLGEALSVEFQEIHGYDIDQDALKRAKLKQIPNSFLYNNLNLIKDDNFDVIVISSVMQYFESLKEVDQAFAFIAHHLKKNDQSRLLIVDLIPKNYTPWKDALENLLFATLNGVALPMLVHLAKAALTKTDLKLLKIDKEEILQIAEKNNFKLTYLNKNLTPSKRRYSCICELV